MKCDMIREACSAAIDGEPAVIDRGVVADHLRGCASCREFAAEAEWLAVSLPPRHAGTAVDLAPRIVQTAREERTVRPFLSSPARIALVAVAAVQLTLAIPSLFFGSDEGAPIHVAHEAGAWDLALAVGFVFAAWRPLRAVGMLPFVGALAAGLLLTAAIDVINGRQPALTETTHLLELVGALLLWVLASPRPRGSILRLVR